jgi:hypothetical protein
MKLNAGIQEALLAILCFDDTPGGARTALALVPPRSYDTYFRDVAEKAAEYLEKYKHAPGEHTLDIVDQLKAQKEDSAEIFQRIYRSLLATKDTINRDYVLARAGVFHRQQKLKALFTQGIGLLQQGKESSVDEAEALLYQTQRNTHDAFEPGLLLNDAKQATSFLRMEDEYFDTDVALLDKYNLGPVRGGLHLFVAGPNKGKSWWLKQLGRAAMLRRKRVLHVTLEMKKEQVAMRYMQMLFSLTKRQAAVVYQRIIKEKGSFVGVEPVEIKSRPSMDLDSITHHILKQHKKVMSHRPPFWIKEFPSGSLTVAGLRAYLDSMEGRHHFMPDLILIDYPDLMRIDPKNKRAETGTTYVELRGVGGERNAALAAVTQANRDAENARKAIIQGKHLSEDYSKFATADTIVTYNQTDEEYQLGLARLFNLKARADVKNHAMLISQAYAMGQFCMHSARMKNSDPKYWQLVGEPGDGGNGTDEEDVDYADSED